MEADEVDGDLRKLFRKNLPQVHWVSVESGFTDLGIPDMNGCHEGAEFWVEAKLARGNVVRIRPGQIAWMSRRHRSGGRTYVAVRQKGTREAVDRLWLFGGEHAARLNEEGLKADIPRDGVWEGGPSAWPWGIILGVLRT